MTSPREMLIEPLVVSIRATPHILLPGSPSVSLTSKLRPDAGKTVTTPVASAQFGVPS